MSFVKKRNISENKKVLFHKIKINNNWEHKSFQAISVEQTKKNFSLEKHLEKKNNYYEELIQKECQLEEKLENITLLMSKKQKKQRQLILYFNDNTLSSLLEMGHSIDTTILNQINLFFGVGLGGEILLSQIFKDENQFQRSFDNAIKFQCNNQTLKSMIIETKQNKTDMKFPFNVLYELFELVFILAELEEKKNELLKEIELNMKEKDLIQEEIRKIQNQINKREFSIKEELNSRNIIKRKISHKYRQQFTFNNFHQSLSQSMIRPNIEHIDNQKNCPKKIIPNKPFCSSSKKLKLSQLQQIHSSHGLEKSHHNFKSILKECFVLDKNKNPKNNEVPKKLIYRYCNKTTHFRGNSCSKIKSKSKQISKISAFNSGNNSKEISLLNTGVTSSYYKSPNISMKTSKIFDSRETITITEPKGTDIPKEKEKDEYNFLSELDDSTFLIPNIRGTLAYLPRSNYQSVKNSNYPSRKLTLNKTHDLIIEKNKSTKDSDCCVSCT